MLPPKSKFVQAYGEGELAVRDIIISGPELKGKNRCGRDRTNIELLSGPYRVVLIKKTNFFFFNNNYGSAETP